MEGDLKRNEAVSPMAGKTPSQEMLVDVTGLERESFERFPDVEDPTQLVSFGNQRTARLIVARLIQRGSYSGHQSGQLRLPANPGNKRSALYGKDTHALSEPIFASALEVLVIDLQAIRESKVRIGVDPLGGASVAYWDAIGDRYELNLEVVSHVIAPIFRFLTVDWEGKIRMDPSSVYAVNDALKSFDSAYQQREVR